MNTSPCLANSASRSRSWRCVAGCTAVIVRPEGDLPKALVVPDAGQGRPWWSPPKTGNYSTRNRAPASNYEAQLGPAHKHMVEEIFRAEFTEAKVFETVDAARLEPGILAIFEPRIEQFSFANAKETGGVYCAVTIRYQIGIYAPNGEQVDTLTLTGLRQRARAEDRQRRGRARDRGLRGDARCGREIPHAVPGAGCGEAAARFAGADAEGSAGAG